MKTRTKGKYGIICGLAILGMIIISQTTEVFSESYSVFSAPQNVGGPLNSAEQENSPFLSRDGLSMYFSGTNRTGGFGSGDIWVSRRATVTSAWGTPQNLGSVINTVFNDNTPSLSSDGLTLFFTSDRTDLGNFGGQDMFSSTRSDPNNDFDWGTPVNMGPVLNSSANEGGQVLFIDPVTGSASLYFLSIRPDTLGDYDIYQSLQNPNGTWNTPVNVAPVNSTARDARPSITGDGLEMFLYSERPGLGLGDVYMSRRASTLSPWNPPVNLGAVNTTESEIAPSISHDGTILHFVSSRPGGLGMVDIYAATRTRLNGRPVADFDGDGATDLAVWRPIEGRWYINNSVGILQANWGLAGDRVVAGDYDGDGKSDFAVFRPSDNRWYRLNSLDWSIHVNEWGLMGDMTVPGDYDGDAKQDLAIWRPSEGRWYVNTGTSIHVFGWGLSGDRPVPADYDNDGDLEPAVFRNGQWWVLNPSNGHIRFAEWGLPGDIPVPADYDGDGLPDIAVFRPSEGRWYFQYSETGRVDSIVWGINGDTPVPSDYDGDGKADIAVFRTINGFWYRLLSRDGNLSVLQWGLSGDRPVAAIQIE